MLICSKWQFQSVDGWEWGNYAYTTRLKGLNRTSLVVKIKFYKTK